MTRIGRKSGRVIVSSGILVGAVVLIGVVPWRLVAAEAEEEVEERLPRYKGDEKRFPGQAKIIAEIDRLGGNVCVLEQSSDKPAIYVAFGKPKLADAGLRHLKGLTNVTSLCLMFTDVTDVGLEHVEGLDKLQDLCLSRCVHVTDAGLKHVRGLAKLRVLRLDGTHVTDAGLAHLNGLTDLRELYLSSCVQVTDAGLTHLKGLTNLRLLMLGHTRVTDAGLENLKGLTRLRRLNLVSTGVTDAGVQALKKALPGVETWSGIGSDDPG